VAAQIFHFFVASEGDLLIARSLSFNAVCVCLILAFLYFCFPPVQMQTSSEQNEKKDAELKSRTVTVVEEKVSNLLFPSSCTNHSRSSCRETDCSR
jgi:hypothetical protein